MRLLLSLIILLFCSGVAPGRVLVMNTDNTFPRSTPDEAGFQDLIIKEAFHRIGVPVRIAHLPSERALSNADKGIDDGDFVRIAGLEQKYPNLVMVPEKISEFEFVAFARTREFEVENWQSLRPYHVGIITGWKILEANVTGTRSLTKVRNDEALFALLIHGRVDLIVFDRLQGLALIKEHGLTGIIPLEPLLARTDMYLYLNRSHIDLVPKLAKVLHEMKQDGTHQRIMKSILEN